MRKMLICGSALVWSALAFGQEIDWLEDQVGALGSGCTPGDIMISAYGNEIDVAFMNFNIFLDPTTGTRTQQKDCRITIPAYVKSGLYIASLNERIDFGMTKTYGTTASFDSRAWFYGWAIARRTLNFPKGVVNPGDPMSSNSINRESLWSVRDYFCQQPNGIRGIYVNQMQMLGMRDAPAESLSFGVGGLNVKWHAIAVAYFCN